MKNRGSSIALGFLALIGAGAVVLSSPLSRNGAEGWGGWFDALFTSFSAVCVTGLSVVDIAAEYSIFGQSVIIFLVEIGCLGLMTCGTFLLIAIGRRLSLAREFSLMNAYGTAQVQGLRGLICWIVGAMLFFESLGALAFWFLLPKEAVVINGIQYGRAYLAVFYSVMSFCNAGFSVLPGSLAAFADNPALIIVSALLTIFGGIGFLVILNLATFKFMRRISGGKGRLSLHSKVVLRFSLYLVAIGFIGFLLLEWNGSLESMSSGKKIWVAFYQAVTPRTCGFCIVPTENLHRLTRLFYEFLMFVGGGPGSAAAGIKVTTFAVLCYTLTAMCRGDSETIIDRKVIPTDVVRESIVIFVVLVVAMALVTGALFWTETGNPALGSDELFFEAVSATTTTGLSMGDTTRLLSVGGRIVILAAMFFGRLGALTVVMMIGDRESVRHIGFPREEIVVG